MAGTQKSHPIEKEHHLNQTSMTLGSIVILQSVKKPWIVGRRRNSQKPMMLFLSLMQHFFIFLSTSLLFVGRP